MDATNLADLYGLPTLDWAPIKAQLDAGIAQAPGSGGPNRHTCWLTTINPDGSPHVTGVGALWVDDAFWFETGEQTRKAKNLIPAPDTGSVRDDLLALLGSIAAFITTPVGEMLLRLALRNDLPEDRTARERFWAERFTTGQTVLERAQARGELRPGLDYRLTIETLIGAIYVRLLLTREPIDDTLTEHVVDLILAGIAAR